MFDLSLISVLTMFVFGFVMGLGWWLVNRILNKVFP